MESENFAIYKLAEAIKMKFSIKLSTKEVLRSIENYRRPYMERRDIEYIPVRRLIIEATRKIVGNLRNDDEEWLSKQYVDIHAKYVKLQKNSLEGLKRMKSIANHLGMITDADTPYTRKLLKSLGIENFFDSVTTAEDVGVGKPNPKIFIEAIKKAKSKKKVYIGDSEKRDIIGAKNVGMLTIKIGKYSKNADFVARDLIEGAFILEKFK